MSTRLNEYAREAIIKEILIHRFGEEVRAIIKAGASLANEVYNDVYSPAERKKLAEFPHGVFQEKETITVQVFQTVRLHFDGVVSYQGAISALMHSFEIPKDERRMYFRHTNGVAKVYEVRSDLGMKLQSYTNGFKSLQEKVAADKKQLLDVMKRTSSSAKLVKAWPEVKPFVDKVMPEVPRLSTELMVPVADLNEKFRLPV